MYCSDTPIFIWYDNYPTHCSTDFLDPATNHCRIAKVEPGNKKGLGAASLNLTNIQVNRALSSASGALVLCATHLLRSINAINRHHDQGHLAVKKLATNGVLLGKSDTIPQYIISRSFMAKNFELRPSLYIQIQISC